jgi:type III restriction enzyme
LKSEKSVFDYVIYDSAGVEKTFAENLEQNENVLVYVKLPRWFKIDTPLGSYNPDWAVVVKDESANKKLFFVVETKGNVLSESLRSTEKAKIHCGKKHFEAIGNFAQFTVVSNFDDFIGMM